MLACSHCTQVETIDDDAEWAETLGAADKLGFSEDEVRQIEEVLAALLHLSNAEFDSETTAHGDDCARLVDPCSVDYAAYLLGVDRQMVKGGLIAIHVKTARDDLMTRMSLANAIENRDAFVSAVYAGLFDWIVNRINAVGRSADEQARAAEGDASTLGKFIGVLDIFGFEIFQTNSFEQLCINFANEKLQRNFTMTTFQAEEGLYTQEAIDFEHIEYVDNQPVLDLLDFDPKRAGKAGQGSTMVVISSEHAAGLAAKAGKRGIIQIIDEEVRLPKVSDRGTLLPKMNAAFGGDGAGKGAHPAYGTDYRTREAQESLFTVKHYAGDVVYVIDGFLEKSMENISAELVAAVKQSSKPLIATLFTQSSSRGEGAVGGKEGGGGGGSRLSSVGAKFSKQLASLISTIDSTDAHYIRCVKPNANKSAEEFDGPLTLEQLRYSGVFEAVAIRKSGYPFRMTHNKFVMRFRLLIPISERANFTAINDTKSAEAMKQTAKEMMHSLEDVSPLYAAAAQERGAELCANGRLGKTMVFYRSAESRALEAARDQALLPQIIICQRVGRGAVARRVRRELAKLRAALNHAIDKKHLETLEAALEGAQVPQCGFALNVPCQFSLPVPNMADILALLADLRLEPVVDKALGVAIAPEQDLKAMYDEIEENYEQAEGLRRRLGRAVSWYDHAEAIVGLTQGVEEHDHERLTACLASSDRLGLASRLVDQCAEAREEVKRLEAGFVFEKAITAALGEGRSYDSGGGVWSHAGISTDALQAATDKGTAHPLVSKSGLRLLGQANAALSVRKHLKASDWKALKGVLTTIREDAKAKAGRGAAKSFGGTVHERKMNLKKVKALENAQLLAESIDTYEEVEAAWRELGDVCAAREKELKAALEAGRSKRVNETKWEHGGIDTAALVAAQTKVETFVHVTEAGEVLVAQAKVARPIREALQKCEWGKAASWAALAAVLDKQVPQSQRSYAEVVAAYEEFGEARRLTEKAVEKELKSGRSKKVAGPGKLWTHEAINTDGVSKALVELNAFPKISDEGRTLAARGAHIVRLRGALKQAELSAPASWGGVADVLERPAALAALGNDEEVIAGQEELGDARSHYESKIKEEMRNGRAKPVAGAKPDGDPSKMWDRSKMASAPLVAAIKQCEQFPRPAASTKALLSSAKGVCELREVLDKTDFAKAASWAELHRFLDGGAVERALGAEGAEKDEFNDARKQLDTMRDHTERCVTSALKAGGSVQKPYPQCWDHSAIDTKALTAAAEECAAFPRPSAEAVKLIASAKLIVTLRSALIKVEPGAVSSWAPLAAVLCTVPPEDLALAEVKLALLEFREARQQVVDAVNAAFKDGCSKPPTPPSKEWDHSSIDSETVVQAAVKLEQFPRVDSSNAKPPPDLASRPRAESFMARRSSLQRLVSEADELVTSAKRIAKLRVVLKAEDWTQVQATISELEKGGTTSPLHESAAEEVKRACQELRDIAERLEGDVRHHLAAGRSKPNPSDKRGFWDHSELATEPLSGAAAKLAAYPLKSEAMEALLPRVAAIVKLRTVLMGMQWGELASLFKAGSLSGELAEMDEVVNAGKELEEMRAATEAELKEALLSSGRSVKVVGAKPVRVVTTGDFYYPLEWQHAGMEEGLERLAAAVDAVQKFPEQRAGIDDLLAEATHAAAIRKLILASDWAGLRKALEAADAAAGPAAAMEENMLAWQELLTYELIKACGGRGVASDQAALKSGLEEANVRGLLPHDAPVFRALDKFIDPPEYQIDLDYPEGDVFPDDGGKVVLIVKVRGATTLRWLKNSIEIREGADNGRITGSHSETLTFNSIVGRDTDQKVWCEATNKWGMVKSKEVTIRLHDEDRKHDAPKGGGVKETAAEAAARDRKNAAMAQIASGEGAVKACDPAGEPTRFPRQSLKGGATIEGRINNLEETTGHDVDGDGDVAQPGKPGLHTQGSSIRDGTKIFSSVL